MKMLKLQKKLVTAAAGALVAFGTATSAMAIPQFQVDPPGATAPFYATSINGGSSERLVAQGGGFLGTAAGAIGYMAFSGFTNDGPLGNLGSIPGIDSGLGNTYGLYLTFSFNTVLTSGTFGANGSEYAVTSLSFSAYRNDDFGAATRTQFTPATLTTNALVNDIGGDDVLLGSGGLIVGTAQITALGGVAFNAITTYTNTAAGNAFFIDPVPFYTLAFSNFNNTSQGIQRSVPCNDAAGGCSVAISAQGGVDFNRVPEPGSLALLGALAIGFGVAGRRARKI